MMSATNLHPEILFSRTVEEKRRSENFPVASLLLPASMRENVHVLYRFARYADDIADNGSVPLPVRKEMLETLKNHLENGHIKQMPECAKEYHALAITGATKLQHGLDLLSAFIQDTTKHRYGNNDELRQYCMLSAAPIGRAMLELANEKNADVEAADNLCNALQLLNHLQDVKSDFIERDRVYLPGNWEGLENQLASSKSTIAIEAAKQEILLLVDHWLARASHLPATIRSRRMRMEVRIIYHIARNLKAKLKRSDIMKERVALNIFNQLKALCSAIYDEIRYKKA